MPMWKGHAESWYVRSATRVSQTWAASSRRRPDDPLVAAGGETRGVVVGVGVPGPLEQEVGIVGQGAGRGPGLTGAPQRGPGA